MELLEFYSSLPTPEVLPSFYVRGYTEALHYYTGVRVVPDYSFVESLPKIHLEHIKAAGFPCYFIPVERDNKCYGYVVKSYQKLTPRYTTKSYIPGLDCIKDGQAVVFVEGIKDSYLLKVVGLPVLPMCTSMISDDMFRFLQEHHCNVLFVPDNDSHRDNTIEKFKKKISKYSLSYFIYHLKTVKDLGDYFVDELRSAALNEAKTIKKLYGAFNAVQQ